MKRRTYQNIAALSPGREFVSRGLRSQTSNPTCSLVITFAGNEPVFEMAMAAVADTGTEVIFVRTSPSVENPSVTRLQNGALMITAPAGSGVHTLRELGIARATGDIVVLCDGPDGIDANSIDDLRARLRSARSGMYVVRSLPLSVVVPVHVQDGLDEVLVALASSDLPRMAWELIVVTDASDPGTEAIASRHANVVVRLR